MIKFQIQEAHTLPPCAIQKLKPTIAIGSLTPATLATQKAKYPTTTTIRHYKRTTTSPKRC